MSGGIAQRLEVAEHSDDHRQAGFAAVAAEAMLICEKRPAQTRLDTVEAVGDADGLSGVAGHKTCACFREREPLSLGLLCCGWWRLRESAGGRQRQPNQTEKCGIRWHVRQQGEDAALVAPDRD